MNQFAQWADAILLVFGLDDEDSFAAVHSFYTRLAYYRDMREVPIMLVGTQDAISETSPRAIDDSHVRQMTASMRHCPYHETCATYGLNIERVFQDGQ
jgi:Arf-GAP/GTPase/ANK repeat/PH domain-containing protein 1/3